MGGWWFLDGRGLKLIFFERYTSRIRNFHTCWCTYTCYTSSPGDSATEVAIAITHPNIYIYIWLSNSSQPGFVQQWDIPLNPLVTSPLQWPSRLGTPTIDAPSSCLPCLNQFLSIRWPHMACIPWISKNHENTPWSFPEINSNGIPLLNHIIIINPHDYMQTPMTYHYYYLY